MIIFFGWICSSIAVVPHIEIGLDQELSMPEDSFVLKYFKVSCITDLLMKKCKYLKNS